MKSQYFNRPLFFVFLFSLCLASSSALWAKTRYVDKWGNNANPCTKTAPCLTIQHVIDLAKKNDKIIVGPGIYNENLTIDTNVNGPLVGLKLESVAGRHGTIIEAAVATDPVISVSQPKVQIGRKGRGFSLEGATSSDGILITTPTASRCKIEGNRSMGNVDGFDLRGEKIQMRFNIAKGNSTLGIYCLSCDQALIRDNRSIDNGSYGLYLAASDKATILRNVASGNAGENIYVASSSEFAKVRDNVAELSTSNDGIFISDADGAVIQGNISSRNGDSVDVFGFWIRQLDFNKSPVIKNNLSVAHNLEGFLLGPFSGLFNAKVEGNTSVQSGNEGIEILVGTSIATLKYNNTIDNDNGGISCGLRNDSGSAITYTKHFFGGGDGECGTSPLNGTIATKPSPLKVRTAAGL